MEYNETNVFARIISGEVPVRKILENESIIAFHDINPVAPLHALVITRKKYINYSDFINNAQEKEIADFFTGVQRTAEILGLEEKGFRLITNNGELSGQTVFHFHVHVIGGGRFSSLV